MTHEQQVSETASDRGEVTWRKRRRWSRECVRRVRKARRSGQAELGAAPSGGEHSECHGPGVRGAWPVWEQKGERRLGAVRAEARREAGRARGAGRTLRGTDAVVRGLAVGLIAMEKRWRVFNKE